LQSVVFDLSGLEQSKRSIPVSVMISVLYD